MREHLKNREMGVMVVLVSMVYVCVCFRSLQRADRKRQACAGKVCAIFPFFFAPSNSLHIPISCAQFFLHWTANGLERISTSFGGASESALSHVGKHSPRVGALTGELQRKTRLKERERESARKRNNSPIHSRYPLPGLVRSLSLSLSLRWGFGVDK